MREGLICKCVEVCGYLFAKLPQFPSYLSDINRTAYIAGWQAHHQHQLIYTVLKNAVFIITYVVYIPLDFPYVKSCDIKDFYISLQREYLSVKNIFMCNQLLMPFYFLSLICGASGNGVHVPCTKLECTTARQTHPDCSAAVMPNEPSNHKNPRLSSFSSKLDGRSSNISLGLNPLLPRLLVQRKPPPVKKKTPARRLHRVFSWRTWYEFFIHPR